MSSGFIARRCRRIQSLARCGGVVGALCATTLPSSSVGICHVALRHYRGHSSNDDVGGRAGGKHPSNYRDNSPVDVGAHTTPPRSRHYDDHQHASSSTQRQQQRPGYHHSLSGSASFERRSNEGANSSAAARGGDGTAVAGRGGHHRDHHYPRRDGDRHRGRQERGEAEGAVGMADPSVRQAASSGESESDALLSAPIEMRRDISKVLFSCPLCRNPPSPSPSSSPSTSPSPATLDSYSLDELAAHMRDSHRRADAVPRTTRSVASPCASSPSSSSYPFSEPHQRQGQASYQRHNTMLVSRLLKRHAALLAQGAGHIGDAAWAGSGSVGSATTTSTCSINGSSPLLPPQHVALLLDAANMERNGVDVLLGLAPLTGTERRALEAAGLVRPQHPLTVVGEGVGCASADAVASSSSSSSSSSCCSSAFLDETIRRHILRVAFSAHPFTFVCMLEDSIVPNCRLMQAVAALATLHPQSAVEVLWVGAGDEAGDYASSAMLGELRRAEREVLLARLRGGEGRGADADEFPLPVANCFKQRRVSVAMAKNAAAAAAATGPPQPLPSPAALMPMPILLLSDDQIQRASMGAVLGVEGFAYSHTYSPVDILQALRGVYWRGEEEGWPAAGGSAAAEGCAAKWSDVPWLTRYLCL